MADSELSLIAKNISSLCEVPLSLTITSLNLHCNCIQRIEGLTSVWHLRHLDLSSNRISRIEGLSSLASLRTLNLSCNLITKVEGLNGLVNLTTLNLSYNQINSLTGLLYLHGAEYKLKHLSLHSNRLDSIHHILQCMLGVKSLREVTLSLDGKDNPVCSLPGYRDMVMQSVPQIAVLDGLDQLGNPASLLEENPCDIPGLEDYVDFLLSSDTNDVAQGDGPFTTPRVDEVLTQFHQRTSSVEATDPVACAKCQGAQLCRPAMAVSANAANQQHISTLEHQSSSSIPSLETVQKAKRDTDHTSESECDDGKENRRRTRIPTHRSSIAAFKRPTKETKSRRTDSNQETHKQKGSKRAVMPRRKAEAPKGVATVGEAGRGPLRTTEASEARKTELTVEEQTYRTIVEERDQERERRWKAEQAVRKLTEQMKSLQTRASEEKDLQSMAVHTTERLKELLLKERAERSGLQTRVEELEEKCQSLAQQLEQARGHKEQHKRALCSLEDSISHGEALRACQQAEEMKRYQELENRATALKREAEIQRASVRQHRDKLQQLHELLTSREQAHRKELESRLTPGGAEFREAVAKEVASVQQSHAHRVAELEEKIADGRKQYATLEDEFRMALTIEAARFSEMKEVCDRLNAELSELKAALAQSQQREKKSDSLVQELTVMVKEQKSRIAELAKAKRDTVTELKARLRSLEAEVTQDRRLNLQLELLKKDKSRLLSQLTAQESVIDGLRAERKIWGQELAQQGASLAQDRGRLEARIEVLGTELETQRKQNERDNDGLKIKTKIIDDQTETIRKLKEALQGRDEQIRRLREEALQAQKKFQQQLEEELAPMAELRERVKQLILRKEELKQQLEDKEMELEEVKGIYSASNKKWQEKAALLTQLEGQVKRMKETFDSKECLLLEERDKATRAHKAAVEKLRCVDDAFRQQLESLQVSHQAEVLQIARDKQTQIEQASQKVFQVEEEMRQLLEETQTNKRIMEEKMRRLTSVLRDF
ncbi:leucine-rich repeat and coiled-coil domain-containing protein 1 [Lampris incognitus]|uniref:leucine-rich repeat and coiled-coil domain-containing protein 1 n=1 Tax=Lampris incognitus TaxID=2546036 RepID=UPI0024B5486B|nr:leucine-rich repeat and coiled-coil domain-containing protein 1 [Lampris incognitus]